MPTVLKTAEYLGRRVAEIALRYHLQMQHAHQHNKTIYAR